MFQALDNPVLNDSFKGRCTDNFLWNAQAKRQDSLPMDGSVRWLAPAANLNLHQDFEYSATFHHQNLWRTTDKTLSLRLPCRLVVSMVWDRLGTSKGFFI
jgi:hypothetical protein